MALFASVFCFASCDDDEKVEALALLVTAANLNGTWQLSEWNGQTLAEGTHCYITSNCRELTLEIYQKFDSMYARYITGSLDTENDPYLGYVISDEYDFGNGDWSSDYVVTDLLESGSAIWTVRDDDSDVSKYVYCEKAPESVIEEARISKNQGKIEVYQCLKVTFIKMVFFVWKNLVIHIRKKNIGFIWE